MTTDQIQAFERLTADWLHHQELRESDAPVAELWRSRHSLDQARLDAHLEALATV